MPHMTLFHRLGQTQGDTAKVFDGHARGPPQSVDTQMLLTFANLGHFQKKLGKTEVIVHNSNRSQYLPAIPPTGESDDSRRAHHVLHLRSGGAARVLARQTATHLYGRR